MAHSPVAIGLEQCIGKLRRGELQETDLQDVLAQAQTVKRQDLLYLQAANTGLNSAVNGMATVIDGEWSDGPPDPKDWPYRTVLEAIRDGWRVLQFPNMALLLDESRTYGLGAEFILER